jgi:Skp family chaperone for outer membrane proteins
MKKAILFVVMLSLVAFVSVSIAADAPKAATTAPAKAASTAPAKAATTAPAPAKKETFKGEIKSMDAMAKSIVVAKGKEEKTFVITDDTKITKGKAAIKFEDLKAGLHVHIGYKKEMDKNVAATIQTYAPKAHPKEK